MTPAQLQRIRDGARLVAFPIEPQPERDAIVVSSQLCHVISGHTIDSSLPGLTWGKARAVRREDVAESDLIRVAPDKGDMTDLAKLWRDTEWLWLVEVRDA